MNNNVWEIVLDSNFSSKSNLLQELKNNSKFLSYDKNSYTLKIRVFKKYVEKTIINNLNKIKREYEIVSKNSVEKIYINNLVFLFEKKEKNLEQTREINNFKISFEAVSEEENSNNDNQLNDLITKKEIVKLTFYNEILFFTKKVEINLSKFEYKDNLKKGVISLILIIPAIYFFTKYFRDKRYVNDKKEEINSLISLKYQPLNKKTDQIINRYILSNNKK